MQKSQIVSILTALIVALALWIYVVTVVNPEDTVEIRDIPVNFVGQDVIRDDYGLIVASGQDSTVTLKLTGKRSELSQLSAANIGITVDMSTVRRAKSYTSNYSVTYPANVNTSEISITERSPGAISYTVVNLTRKEIEVRGSFDGTPAEGYEVGTMTFDQESIEISGADEDVAPIAYALVTISRTNLQNTVIEYADFTLMKEDDTPAERDEISTSVDQVQVTLPVSKLKEVPLHVNLLYGGGVTEANAFVTIEPSTIKISGDAAVVDGFNYSPLGNIDLSEIEDVATYEFPIIIPNQAKNVSGEETATVTVELRGLSTKKIRAGSVEFIGESEDLITEPLTSQVLVSIRGPSEDVEQVSSNNVRAVADLTNYNKPGTYEVPVTIYIDGFPNVGIIGEKTISVSLVDRSEANTGEEGSQATGSGESPDSAESG